VATRSTGSFSSSAIQHCVAQVAWVVGESDRFRGSCLAYLVDRVRTLILWAAKDSRCRGTRIESRIAILEVWCFAGVRCRRTGRNRACLRGVCSDGRQMVHFKPNT
jgi:hypothetical protein